MKRCLKLFAISAVLIAASSGSSCITTPDSVPGWHPLGVGIDGIVKALTVYNGELIAGGEFLNAGGIGANNIARWDGESWKPLGTGTDLPVFALTVYNDELIVGGELTTAGGVSVARIARWDGTNWHALGDGMGGPTSGAPSVYSLTVYKGNLIAGGAFTEAGGISATRIARWDGLAWHALGDGITDTNPNDVINALTVFDDDLIVGGFFASAGTATAQQIARWDGATWHAIGTTLDDQVYALDSFGGQLIQAGSAANADSTEINGIAALDGTAWQALANGTDGDTLPLVTTLTTFDDALIAGGHFTKAGGHNVNYIAQWNGTDWQSLGTGMNGGSSEGPAVLAVIEYDSALIAAGDFTSAGGVNTRHIARWVPEP